MKVSLLQENLSEALGKVSKAISTRPQLPVLANVLVEARKDGLYLSGTDLEMAMTIRVGAKIEKIGKTTVPARMFAEFVGSLSSGTIEMELLKETLHINSGSYKAKLQTISHEEFPELPDIKSTKKEDFLEIEAGELMSSVEKVVFAAARDSMRPVLTGVYFEFKGKKLNLVATDGFRLAVDVVSYEGDKKIDSFIIPSRVVAEVAKFEGEKVKIAYLKETGQVLFTEGEEVILGQVLEGTFPDYKRIIPDDPETLVLIEREELLQAVRATQVFARDNSNVMKWIVKDKGLTITAESPEQGENKVQVEGEIEGQGGEVAYNGKFLLDFLQVSKQKRIKYGMSGALAPGLFTGEEEDGFLYVVMPINL